MTWEKVLWKKQKYPDNYVSRLFLSELRRNASFERYQLWSLCVHSAPVALELATIVVFMLVFVLANGGWWTASDLLWVAGGVSAAAVLASCGAAASRPLLGLTGCLLALAPVLGSLTDAVSDDTIYAMSGALAGLHSLTFNYGQRVEPSAADATALNAAMSAAVLLASRLPSSAHVFGFLSIAVILFGPFARARLRLRQRSPLLFALGAWLLAWPVVTFLTFQVMGQRSALVYCSVQLFIGILGPIWLVALQGVKNTISGPWQEAKPPLHIKLN